MHQFDFIKKKYPYVSSWAIWSEAGKLPKSNVGDLSILDPKTNKNLLSQLNVDTIFLGLNISRGDIKKPLANFHDSRPESTDFKIRYALKNTPFWGSYMTDIIKDFEQKISCKVRKFIRENKPFEEENIKIFRQELKDIGAKNPTLIAFGNDTYDILKRHFKEEYKIKKVPHYANYTSKETYREQVISVIAE